ncbi:HAMP domain-containing protein [Elusimicrobiota bacterium]
MSLHNRYPQDELKSALSLTLIALITIEGILIGLLIFALIQLARNWQEPNHAIYFFLLLGTGIISFTSINYLLSAKLSMKIGRPLSSMAASIREVRNGNLRTRIEPKEGDMLEDLTTEFNSCISSLEKIVFRDRKHIEESRKILEGCRKKLNHHTFSQKDKEDMSGKLLQALSLTSFINEHFTFKK